MRLLSEIDVDRLFEIGPATDVTEQAFRAMQRGEAMVPLRSEIHRLDPPGGALIMPALLGNETLGVKLVTHVYTREEPPQRLATGMMIIWDAMTLEPRGLIAANTFNDHRTAAGLAAATRVLARPEFAHLHGLRRRQDFVSGNSLCRERASDRADHPLQPYAVTRARTGGARSSHARACSHCR